MQNVTDTLIMPVPPPVTQRLGPYELLHEAGRGGMSVVYEALDRRDQRTVAVKVLTIPHGLSRDQEEAMLGRFSREARAVAGLSHPNIVTIHELGSEAGRHYLAMEYLHGETLRDRLLHGPLTPAQAEPILRQVAAAVDAVHAQGVVHRDIKPSNVMLLPDGSAKLLDFGVSRQSDDTTITGTGALVGSPAYLSPEQIRGDEGTAASDRWALGVLLYEMLAGRPPFTGNNIPAVLYQVTHEAPPPVIGIPSTVQRVLRRALDKHPSRRYPTAGALADALHTALPGQMRPIVRPRPMRQLWPARRLWLALLPILLGAGLVALTRHSGPSLPQRQASPSVSAPAGTSPPANTPSAPHPASAQPITPVRRHASRHHAQPKHPAVRHHHPAPPTRHTVTHHRWHHSRRLPERWFRMAAPHRAPAASATSNLEHFIYSPESP